MPTTPTATPGTKKLLEQSATRIAENFTGGNTKKQGLRKKLRQFFSF
jgi:hypothetical protein